MIPILYDGWPLVYQPNSPAALHLLAMLAYCPREVQPMVALPYTPPGGLPVHAIPVIQPTPETPQKRLWWEQSHIPKLAQRQGAQLIHSTSMYTPLFTQVPAVISPAGFDPLPGFWKDAEAGAKARNRPGFYYRLRQAAAQGGLARARAILWPEDLPTTENRPASPPIIKLPPVVHPEFRLDSGPIHAALPGLDLPDRYILYHGPCTRDDLRCLLAAWSWATHPIGDACPLLILGLDEAGRACLADLLSEYNLGNTVSALPELAPGQIPALYQRCVALFHPSPSLSPWGEPLRHALACGRPVVAAETSISDALVGPAGYLVPADESRGLGAALITVTVEESVEESLSRAALQRSSGWHAADFTGTLLKAYQTVIFPHLAF